MLQRELRPIQRVTEYVKPSIHAYLIGFLSRLVFYVVGDDILF